jgi:hypothetical protein
MSRRPVVRLAQLACLSACVLASGCSAFKPKAQFRTMIVTAYCGSGADNGYSRGHWWLLHVDFWNKYIDYGPHAGEPYDGRTASGAWPHPPRPGLASLDTLTHPWMLPVRLVFPWLWPGRKGTLAADTDYYPFGTEMDVPGWGWGVVEDRGGAIKGPDRLDIFFRWGWQSDAWGIQSITCTIRRAAPQAPN